MNKGVTYATATYILWGFFPIFFKLIQSVPAVQIVAHRILWSFLLLMGIIAMRKEFPALRKSITPKTIAIYALASGLLTINWLTYVWAINAGYVVETSLGYFITPLVNVLLGVVILREKLRPLQWLPVGVAAAGVTYLTLGYGSLPWIALTLAFTFGLYGLIKKLAPLGSLYGLTLETSIIVLPSLGYILYVQAMGSGALGNITPWTTILLLLTGVVTIVPLLLFASGVRLIPLTVIGLLQFISPTLQFLSGVLLFGESFNQTRLIGFSMIWLALIIFSAENLLSRRKALPPLAA